MTVPKKKRPSMKDVAQLAGVSRTTVSFVLNDKSHFNIPDTTKQRIFDAVEELGYRPNAIARGLRSQRTNTIGFISDEVTTTPFAGRIIQGAQELAWDKGYLLLLVHTGNNREMKKVAVETLLDRQVDGIIYATMYHREVAPPETIREVPAVLLDCFMADGSLPSVVPNELSAAKTAVTHLLEKGHRRIGFVRPATDVVANRGRLAGYKQALAEWDVPFDPALVWTEGLSVAHSGYRGAMSLMKLDNRPTAFFCFTDGMAMGVYDALRHLNLRIPDDVAVVGFDNQEVIAPFLHPSLTTMQLPHFEMGQWAVEHLLNLLGQERRNGKNPIQHELDCPLVARQSA